jgi:hypothetical protein
MKHLKKRLVLGLFIAAVLVSFVLLTSLRGVSKSGNEDPVRFDPNDSMKVTQAKIELMREEIRRNGDTFEVGVNPAIMYSLDELCMMTPDAERSAAYAIGSDISDDIIRLPTSYQCCKTPVKNQGTCGAWALVTCDMFECAIQKATGLTVDLSEQWLIDCNTLGYTCLNGWFAHDMHVNPGAVLGSAYIPGNCVGPYAHPYILNSWAYVGNSSSVPSVTAIKTAIYRYCTVGCLVYANSYFQAYTAGCFSQNSAGAPNHFVMLIGWDDSKCTTGAWRLKNTWGTSWGESGYMWIKYGVQQVGYAANYVVY